VARNSRRHASHLLGVLLVAAIGCGPNQQGDGPNAGRLPPSPRWGGTPVFTPAHETTGAAVRDFFGIRPEARQPLDFSHRIHLEKEVLCVDCHEGVERSARAGLPSVNTCMICHSQIATDRPLIKTIADMQAKGLDLAWQRVYGYAAEAHVRFEHAPHVRAKVDCATCHGNLAQQTVAERAVNMEMAFCVNCHKEKQASIDCLTCHY
jgi:hypothetical protein